MARKSQFQWSKKTINSKNNWI